MTERIVGRPWSSEEDKLLKQAVEEHGEYDNWKTIALAVPGRTNKACRKRWLHSLSPTVKKSAWTATEDQQLLEFYALHGPRWSTIARQIPGRTDDACSKRYREALDPTLKKDEWTEEEDAKLMQRYARIGGKWGQVGQDLKRSGLACRNRWRLLERKKAAILAREVDIRHIFGIHDPEPPLPEPPQIEYSPHSHLEHPPAVWPPYYATETYPTFPPDDNSHIEHAFHQTPHKEPIPPFQFSSSSLSAALSDPPPISRPLPPITTVQDHQCNSEPASSISPSPPRNGTLEDCDDDRMSLDDYSISPQTHCQTGSVSSVGGSDSQSIGYYYDDSEGIGIHDSGVYLAGPRPGPRPDDTAINTELWKSPFAELPEQPFPPHCVDTTPESSVRDDVPSSAASTPLGLVSSLSPTSSPNIATSVELPGTGPVPSGSLLFSSHYRSASPKRKRKPIPKTKRPVVDQGPTRLSSKLRLSSDPSVLPYACGHERCWPSDATRSIACFSTSKELFEHNKNNHGDDSSSDRPFRCGLAGCGKSWKSINGLQYHLQISTAHFRNALSTTFSQSSTEGGEPPPAPDASDSEGSDKAKRTYVCQHPGCFKAYRQLSGLRYHRKHGHPQEMPIQLEIVPPTLARQIPAKTKKMRRKDSPEPAP